MLKSKGVIVGIDPGVITACAVMDLDGKLIWLNSKREYGLAELTRDISKQGKVLALACDVSKIPELLMKLSKNLQAMIIKPDENFGTRRKRKAVKNYDKELVKIAKNKHEIDAIFAVIFAYKHFAPFINKIKALRLNEEKKQQLIIKLLTKEHANIKEALRHLV